MLHGCLAHPDTTPRHVMALLATLASNPVVRRLSVLGTCVDALPDVGRQYQHDTRVHVAAVNKLHSNSAVTAGQQAVAGALLRHAQP